MNKFLGQHIYISLALVASILGMIASIFQIYNLSTQPKEEKQNIIFEKQIETLDRVQDSLDTLKNFVKGQKTQLVKSQQVISDLKNEQKKLKPIVQADRETVEALFALQSERQKRNVWAERAMGLFLGITGSLVASLVWSYLKQRKN